MSAQSLRPGLPRPASRIETRRSVDGDTYWLATVDRDGRPSVVAVLAVWLDGALYFCARGAARDGRTLVRDPRCSVAVSTPGLDLVVEGEAARVRDESILRRVASAYEAEYGWRVGVRDGRLHDEERGGGPRRYDVFEFRPTTPLQTAVDDTLAPTRWSL